MSNKGHRKRANSAISKEEFKRRREAKELRQLKTGSLILGCLLALVIICVLFFNSAMFYRSATAVVIDNVKFSLAEYNYYYYNYYFRYISAIGGYDSENLKCPANGVDLEKQMYDAAAGKTWKDFFEEKTLEELRQYTEAYHEAEKLGFTIASSDFADYEIAVADYETRADEAGLKLDDYLEDYYGKGVNSSVLKKCLEFLYTANSMIDNYHDFVTVSGEQISERLEKEPEMYNSYEYMYFLVSADIPDKKDFSSEAEYEAAREKALEQARDRAMKIADEVSSDGDMLKQAAMINGEKYSEENSVHKKYAGMLLGSSYGTWLTDTSRKNGDMTVVDIPTGSYVVRYLATDGNDQPTANVELIKIAADMPNPDAYTSDEDSSAYDKAVSDALTMAEKSAESVLAEWQKTPDEETFKKLYQKYSDTIAYDTETPGHYENCMPGTFGQKLSEWCDSKRAAGDMAVLFEEAENAYYIIRFVSDGEIYRNVLAELDIRDSLYNVWCNSLGENAAVNFKLFYNRTMSFIPELQE